MSNWLPFIHPVELYGVLTLSGAALLYAFLMHLKMTTLERGHRAHREELERRMSLISGATESLQSQLDEALRPSPAPGGSLQLNRRGRVLHMRNRGEKPESISAALGIPRNEVDLLLKIHQVASARIEKRG